MSGRQQITNLRSKKGKGRTPTLFVNGKVDINIYMVSDEQLSQLEEISDSSNNNVTWALFFFNFGGSLLVSLLTIDIKNILLYTALVCVTTMFSLLGFVKITQYKKDKKKIKSILNKIRKSKCRGS